MITYQFPAIDKMHEYPYVASGGGGTGSIDLYDEGVLQGPITELNAVGSVVTASVAGNMGTLSFSQATTPIDVVAVDTDLDDTHSSVVFNTIIGGTLNCNLPDASLYANKRYRIKNNGSGHVLINAYGIDTIDGNTSMLLSNQYESVMIQSTGSDWVVW